ncbi:MAG: tetratricopeptide repeat protein [Chitinispirillaceae bacterium]|nr:tetratricopeptide repeat protein [Chitinispirillaceae bacterium]
MEPSLLAGRKVQKHILKSLLSAALGKAAPKGKETAAVVPRLFLFDGENGTGKTSMVNMCIQNVVEIAEESGKPVATMILDLDAWRYKNGMVPKTPKAMLDALYATASGTFENPGEMLEPFNRLRSKIIEVESARRYYTVIEWPREVFMTGRDSNASGEEAAFQSWIEQKIDPADCALCADPVAPLTAAFIESLVNLSGKYPFVLCVDSLELAATPEVEEWFIKDFLSSLFKEKNNVVCICSGAGGFVRRFRNECPEETLYPLSLSALPLSRGDIAELCGRKGVTLAPEEIEEIERRTSGIPLAVQTLLDHARANIPVRDVLPEKSAKTTDKPDIAGVVGETVDRFVLSGDESTRMRLFALSMLYRLDENILAELWGVPGAEIAPALAAIADRYPSLMQGDKPHGTVRDLLKGYCIDDEATKTADSGLSEFFKRFASVHSTFYAQYCAHLQTEMPDAVARYADSGFQITLCGLVYSLALSSRQEFEKQLPGYFIEALQYNPDFAALLLDTAVEVSPLLTDNTLAMVDALRSGLALAAEIKAPMIPGKPCDPKTADFMNKFASGLTDIQQGLLHRIKGHMACHAGKYGKAMEEFTRSETLFGPSAPERGLLFENFLCVGYAFLKSDEKKKAAESFGKATAIKPDDFYAWLEMAKAQQSLGDHKSAIGAYSEAVRINAEAGDAWFELGNEYAATGEHGHAVEAFTRATQLESDRPAAWYNLGGSLEAVSRFPEAQKAYQTVVSMVPEHGEAFFALGRSFSAQNMTQEAIDAFTRAVGIRPECTEAWKALGRELLAVESFEQAAGALEKAAAAEQDKNDPELWHTIGKAWFGAGKFEDSIRCCRKAVEMRKDFFDAWVTLGQGLTELGNFKDAHEAFAKGADLNPKDGNIWVSVGNSLYSQEKYQPAIEAYLKATELRPDTDTIWHSIGLAYQLQRKYAKAIDAFQKSIDTNPNVPEVWYQQGCSYAELGKHAEASACFSKTVELAPDTQDAWYRMGLSLAKTGKHAEAVPAFIKAVDINASDAGIWYNLGLSYAATGNGPEAVKAFTQSIGIADNRPEAYYQLGLAHESLGAFEQAIPAYQKAAGLQPENVEPWLHFGLCCNSLSRYAEAVDALRKVLELAPDNKDVFLPMALAAHAVGNYEEAVSWYRKVIDFKPDSEEAQYNCALALHALNRYDEALAVYKTVVQKWPAKDQAWYNMGLVHHAMNDLKQAIAAYREASKLNPESTDTWYQLGIVFYSTEQYGEAILAFRKVTSRRSDLYEAWYNLGNSYLIWREYNDAIASYQKATELKPDDYTAWGYLGSACYSAKAYDKAEQASAKAFQLKSDEPWIIGTLALSKLFAGDAAGAMPLFETLRAADATGQEVAKAVSEIQQALSRNQTLKGGKEVLEMLAGK